MLSGQMPLAFGGFALSTIAASAPPSREADNGGIRFELDFVRSWPLTASATRAIRWPRPKGEICRVLVSSREVALVSG